MKNAASVCFVLCLLMLAAPAIADQCLVGDCVMGKGTLLYSTGHKYVGEFKDGRRDGQGFLSLPFGRTIEGVWRRNELVEGTYTDGGNVYTGSWESRERNGHGVLKFADGRFYEGDFKSGLRTGKGVMTWPDGRSYVGDFYQGIRTGNGTMVYPDGRIYMGDFVNGERTGNGVLILPNGHRLGGQFRNGEYVGPKDLKFAKAVPQAHGKGLPW
jgi:hypothetical protein